MTEGQPPSAGQPIELVLFIAVRAPSAASVVKNVESAIARCTSGRFVLEVIDVYAQPKRALRDRVLVTPALLAPIAASRLVGELNEPSLLDYFLENLVHLCSTGQRSVW